MADFTGAECLICKEKFREEDDIVVCPDCGTPYHRDCYMKEGSCVNTELHEKNESWTKSQKEPEADVKVCKNCGTENDVHAFFCEKCGYSLVDSLKFGTEGQNFGNQQQNGWQNGYGQQNYGNQQQNSWQNGFGSGQNFGAQQNGFAFDPTDKYCGLDPKEEIAENVTVSEASDFIGVNTPYYLMLFKRMKMTGKKLTLNITCIFFPQVYFAYRKMWKESLITILISTILAIPAILYTFAAMEVPMKFLEKADFMTAGFELIARAANYASMAVNIAACLFGNWLYYRHMERKVSVIKVRCGEENAEETIRHSGGVNIGFVVVAAAIQFALAAIVMLSFVEF